MSSRRSGRPNSGTMRPDSGIRGGGQAQQRGDPRRAPRTAPSRCAMAPNGLEVGERAGRPEKPAHAPKRRFDFFVRHALPGVELGKALLDLGHEHEALDRVVDRSVGGKGSKGLDDPFLRAWQATTCGESCSCSPSRLTDRGSAAAARAPPYHRPAAGGGPTPGPTAAGQGRRTPPTAAVSCSRLLGGGFGLPRTRGNRWPTHGCETASTRNQRRGGVCASSGGPSCLGLRLGPTPEGQVGARQRHQREMAMPTANSEEEDGVPKGSASSASLAETGSMNPESSSKKATTPRTSRSNPRAR